MSPTSVLSDVHIEGEVGNIIKALSNALKKLSAIIGIIKEA